MHNSSLNHTFRLVWSECSGTYVAVAENTRGRSKGGRATRVAAVVLAGAALANSALASASPQTLINAVPGTVLAGSNTFSNTVFDGAFGTGFFVSSGSFIVDNATLQNFTTKGGDGSGGGASMGGAIFINSGASVTLNNVNFLGNTAIGGNGGVGS